MNRITSAAGNFVNFGWETGVSAKLLAEGARRGTAEHDEGFNRFGVGCFPDNGGPFSRVSEVVFGGLEFVWAMLPRELPVEVVVGVDVALQGWHEKGVVVIVVGEVREEVLLKVVVDVDVLSDPSDRFGVQ